MENPSFLKEKYNLHASPEVASAVKRTEKKTGEKVPQDPSERVQNYLDRFSEIIERKDPDKRERGLTALKQVLHDKFVIKPQEIPESYFDTQRRLAREQGHGDVEITDEARSQLTEVIITDQQTSLDLWTDYLTSPDATYPDWLKYYAFRSILGMGDYDKEKKKFTKRDKGTVKPFPDLNREALAYVLDAIEKKHAPPKESVYGPATEDQAQFEGILKGENFAKLYAWAIEKVTPASKEALANTKGKWVKYDQNSDHMPLVQSLQGHGTNWCTAGESTAQRQLEAGDFYVYYSLDPQGQPTIPRAAIRMEGDRIGEVRGIAGQDQNMDPYIMPVVQQKLKEFPDGTAYEKKSADMKLLTTIENKVKKSQPLTKDELIFLYEIDKPIEGFGYKKDPRVKELRDQRNPKADAPLVLDCQPDQIAWNQQDITENTKAYIGPLFQGVFQQNFESVYTFFPEGKIRNLEATIGGKSKQKLLKELKQKFKVSPRAQQMIENDDFTVSTKPEHLSLVRLSVRDLGFPQGATTDQIYQKRLELGLELCPAETGPNLRLQYADQPMNEYLYIGMKHIAGSVGDPHIFSVERYVGDAWLDARWATPGDRWRPEGEFVFLFPSKLET